MGTDSGVVTVLLSAPQQVAIFAPIVEALEGMGIRCRVLTLDWWYGRDAAQTAEASGHIAEVIPGNGNRPPVGFYRRFALKVWRDVLRARGPITRALSSADVLILGNDSGLLEKVAIGAAHSRGLPAILIQDGRLARERPGAETVRATLLSATKALVSPWLRFMGLSFLAASRYGAGGTDLAIASGAHGATVLRLNARGTRVVVGGQPKYDSLAAYPRGGDPRGPVVVFTTPFAADGLGRVAQAAQESFAEDLAAALAEHGVDLVVKPHPRESPRAYSDRVGDQRVSNERPAELLARARAAVIGISSVTEEAGLLACPVLVPGRVVHGGRFDRSLPDPAVYPRFESATAMARAIDALSDPAERSKLVEPQRGLVAEEVMVDPDRPAARIHADLILSLLGDGIHQRRQAISHPPRTNGPPR